ncbi:MAG: hypothetical protein AUG51_19175 [Acidobacteria bacterium 13_1_20CM_3_53_8]|nr:MAG: hypothetical protein AUG51_19175 [Acidobacteria bacterium 13_1_20CM_3_53_8]
MSKRINRSSLRIALILALAVTLIAGLGITLRQTTRAQSRAEAAVRDTLMKSTLSFERNDLAMATKVWANDESLTVFEQGHANYGWADYRDHHLVPEMAEFKNTKYSLDNIKVHLVGKTAWATFTYTISGDVDARHVDSVGLGTAVLEERQGNWQIVHWHSSAPRRAPA